MNRGTLMVAAGIVLGAVGMTAARHDERHEAVSPLSVREIAEKLDGGSAPFHTNSRQFPSPVSRSITPGNCCTAPAIPALSRMLLPSRLLPPSQSGAPPGAQPGQPETQEQTEQREEKEQNRDAQSIEDLFKAPAPGAPPPNPPPGK